MTFKTSFSGFMDLASKTASLPIEKSLLFSHLPILIFVCILEKLTLILMLLSFHSLPKASALVSSTTYGLDREKSKVLAMDVKFV
ncbi:hypothetical protein LCE44_04935 [Vibrio harveyi]|uniref:hypothetical protein n=1 Tax=Vibrio harveyi TaxID=669 RepID=UPI003BF63940